MERRLRAAITPVLGAALVLGCVLRFIGLTRGDLEDGTDAFLQFHPDQHTLLDAAQRLQDPTDPPLTAYGLLPIYLAAGALEVSRWLTGNSVDLTTTDGQRDAVLAVRALAALLSCLTLGVLWLFGRRYFGRAAACVAVVVMAAAPLAVQQAHFYTVDGVFCLLVLAAVYAAFAAAEGDDWRLYLLCGALVGAAGAVRLNGLLTGLVLLTAHLARPRGDEAVGGRRALDPAGLASPRLWLSGLGAVAVLVAIQPYMVVAPERLAQSLTPDDLAYSVGVARGEFLRPWSLVDVHTVPYLHFWTELWPTGVGWPLTAGFLVAIGHTLWRPRRHTLLLLLWLALYFIPVGGLHTKHVRYLLPMLPFLGLLFGDAIRGLIGRCPAGGRPRLLRPGLYTISALIIAYTLVYGVAFARIYGSEDSRIAARRWLDANLPRDARIAIEHGGFSMQGALGTGRYRPVYLDMGFIFGSRGYLSCAATVRLLRHQLATADVALITDVNRYRQFTAVPELFPVTAAFYEGLVGGELGFDVARRFKVYPRFLGWTFEDDEAEPSFLGYDHPAVILLRKSDSFEQSWSTWQRRFRGEDGCAESALAALVTPLEDGRLETALERTTALCRAHPEMRFAAMIQAHLLQRLGRSALAEAALERYAEGYGDPSIAPNLIAPATALSLTTAGLTDLGLAVLEEAAQRRGRFVSAARAPMARAYELVAELLQGDGEDEYAYRVRALAAEVHPAPASYNALAEHSSARGDYERAVHWWEESLRADGTQVGVHRRLVKAAYTAADYPRVIDHLHRVLELEPAMETRRRRETLNLLGALSDSTGQYGRARDYWQASLSIADEQPQIHRDLGLLLARHGAADALALAHLERAAALAPVLREQLADLIAQLEAGRRR